MSSPGPGRRPGSARPDGGSRTAARAAVRRTAARTPPASAGRAGLTTRAAVLGLVLCALVLSAAVPLREFLAQRGDIRRAEAAQAQQRDRIAALEQRTQQLQDPERVKQEARERFGFVMPGETLYTVLRPEQPAQVARKGDAAPAGPEAPWYSQVWGSVKAADAR